MPLNLLTREASLKGKAQYSWPPCILQFVSGPFTTENIIYPFFKTSQLTEEVNCTEPSPQLVFLAGNHYILLAMGGGTKWSVLYKTFARAKIKASGLCYKSFINVIYSRNESGQCYKTTMMIIIDDTGPSQDRKLRSQATLQTEA